MRLGEAGEVGRSGRVEPLAEHDAEGGRERMKGAWAQRFGHETQCPPCPGSERKYEVSQAPTELAWSQVRTRGAVSVAARRPGRVKPLPRPVNVGPDEGLDSAPPSPAREFARIMRQMPVRHSGGGPARSETTSHRAHRSGRSGSPERDARRDDRRGNGPERGAWDGSASPSRVAGEACRVAGREARTCMRGRYLRAGAPRPPASPRAQRERQPSSWTSPPQSLAARHGSTSVEGESYPVSEWVCSVAARAMRSWWRCACAGGVAPSGREASPAHWRQKRWLSPGVPAAGGRAAITVGSAILLLCVAIENFGRGGVAERGKSAM